MSQQFIYQLNGERVWSKRGNAFYELEQYFESIGVKVEHDKHYNIVPNKIEKKGEGQSQVTIYYFPNGHRIIKRKLIKNE